MKYPPGQELEISTKHGSIHHCSAFLRVRTQITSVHGETTMFHGSLVNHHSNPLQSRFLWLQQSFFHCFLFGKNLHVSPFFMVKPCCKTNPFSHMMFTFLPFFFGKNPAFLLTASRRWWQQDVEARPAVPTALSGSLGPEAFAAAGAF